jgi:hypothetical protein
MRMTSVALSFCLLFASFGVRAADQKPATLNEEHPGDTALVPSNDGHFEYKSFPALLQLYIYTRDSPGKSNCVGKCPLAWPPLLVSAVEANKTVGAWTIIVRENGTRQWAYKGQPVYTRFHNMPFDSLAEQEGFQPLKP